MKLVVGLGNPGSQYARTRHNAGWLVVDEVARRWGAVWRKEKDAEVAEVRIGPRPGAQPPGAQPGETGPGPRALLVKPQTFMNTSGKAVGPLFAFYKLDPGDLLAVQDDLDSSFGLLKFRLGGRHGGQNGVRDLIRVLGTDAFARLKVGISRPPPGWEVSDWVLSRWREEEAGTLAELVRLGADAVEVWVRQGLAEGQTRFNGTDLRPRVEPPSAPESTALTAPAGVADSG